ncbi:hypothetical protein K4K61_002727 [Colletotrichum sp. SAR11_59]|nr:hypothetical protein K4K61_002727 [Colletotrichum sp. SAR11_59]
MNGLNFDHLTHSVPETRCEDPAKPTPKGPETSPRSHDQVTILRPHGLDTSIAAPELYDTVADNSRNSIEQPRLLGRVKNLAMTKDALATDLEDQNWKLVASHTDGNWVSKLPREYKVNVIAFH